MRAVESAVAGGDLAAVDGSGDDVWHCSSNLRGGMYTCPEGLESLVFCPDNRACVEPGTPVAAGAEPYDEMCPKPITSSRINKRIAAWGK